MMEAGRGMKGTLDSRTPGDDRDLGAGRGRQRGETGQGKAVSGSREEILGMHGMGGKRRRAVEAVGQGRRPGGRSLRARVIWGGGQSVTKRERSGSDG